MGGARVEVGREGVGGMAKGAVATQAAVGEAVQGRGVVVVGREAGVDLVEEGKVEKGGAVMGAVATVGGKGVAEVAVPVLHGVSSGGHTHTHRA